LTKSITKENTNKGEENHRENKEMRRLGRVVHCGENYRNINIGRLIERRKEFINKTRKKEWVKKNGERNE
jgi:hypothetical protein